VFVVFPTSTTHAPFGPVPPYQPAWSRVLTRDAYDPADVARAMAINPDLANLGPSYVRAMAYEYRSIAGYLRQRSDDAVLIVIGDHQPPAAVSGKDAPWHVPVHVIGRREKVLDALRERGFRPGVQPQRPSIGPMHQLTPVLLDAFDQGDATLQTAADGPGTPRYFETLNGRRVPPPIASASRPPRMGNPYGLIR
jgi:hypothetical protein